MISLPEPIAFNWDQFNTNKILIKHHLEPNIIEEAFFDTNKKILKDTLHSEQEKRYVLLGKTNNHKILFIVFTLRNKQIRVISARPLNKSKKHLYEK